VQPDDNSIRVTLDREVRCAVERSAGLRTEMDNPCNVFGERVVLELKFTGRFPDWFGELVRAFDLHQCSAAKYADGVALMGENRFSLAGVTAPGREHARRKASRLSALRTECPQLPLYSEAAQHV
jgi:hypothetical protein